MTQNFWSWFKIKYSSIVNSIAFIPAFIAISFLGIAVGMIFFDYSETGKNLKKEFGWLSLNDATTARSIIQSIVTGIISLAVFSFTMVMIVLNQAASNMSNRVLDKLIGNRFQQIILGIYLGTIVYGLSVLTTIRDIDDGIYVPALSTYFLILLTVIDIFLFIYFLHYITQSVKYGTIIRRICSQTKESMKNTCTLVKDPEDIEIAVHGIPVGAKNSGIYEGFEEKALLKIAEKENVVFHLLVPPGTYILKDFPFMTISSEKKVDDDNWDKILKLIFFTDNEKIEANYTYGLRQLMEIAVRGLSPGTNDPGTAVEALRALSDLLLYRIKNRPINQLKDSEGVVRIITSQKKFEQIFEDVVYPIWHYGKKDRLIQQELMNIIRQLQSFGQYPVVQRLY
ncbi:MAG: DUF2254 domain-containing protein, partial [Chitinophagaceae bacterium]